MQQWFMGMLVAASVGLNAVLYQQLVSHQTQTEEAKENVQRWQTRQSLMSKLLEDSQAELQAAQQQLEDATQTLGAGGGMMDFSKLPMRTIQQMGHLFFANKVSETLMDDDLMDILGYDDDMLGREQYLTNYGFEMLSVRVSPSELESEQLDEATIESMVDRLDEAGMVLIPALHDRERCRRLAHSVHRDILNPEAEFGNIRYSEYRKDLPLLLEGDYLEILRDTLKLLQPVFEQTLGKGAVLKEFSSLTSYPGAQEQEFHPDSFPDNPEELNSLGKLFSAFIYLDDVGEFAAPFDAIPGSHTHYHFVDDYYEDLLLNNPWVRLAVPQGSLVIYDSRMRHRGSGNTSPFTRPTLYFSLAEGDQTKEFPVGPTYSLDPSYQAKLTVEDIIARDIPPASMRDRSMEQHDDDVCKASMRAACADVQHSPKKFYKCATDPEYPERNPRLEEVPDDVSNKEEDLYRLLPLEGCAIRSRMERIAKLHIFKNLYKAKVSWGNL